MIWSFKCLHVMGIWTLHLIFLKFVQCTHQVSLLCCHTYTVRQKKPSDSTISLTWLRETLHLPAPWSWWRESNWLYVLFTWSTNTLFSQQWGIVLIQLSSFSFLAMKLRHHSTRAKIIWTDTSNELSLCNNFSSIGRAKVRINYGSWHLHFVVTYCISDSGPEKHV